MFDIVFILCCCDVKSDVNIVREIVVCWCVMFVNACNNVGVTYYGYVGGLERELLAIAESYKDNTFMDCNF